MTPEILLVLALVAGATTLFVTGWLPLDLTALLVLAVLAVTGLVTAEEALSGFSSPAVITVAGMFVISAGLARTGVAGRIGRQVLRMSGEGEGRLVAVIMATAGGLSAVMNNIGVAAMMLPAVMDISRRTGRPPSRLLLPLALACLMGGLLTLVGTPPNIVVSDILVMQGLEPFHLFEFTPVGLVILAAGVAFVVFGGRHLLPVRDPRRESEVGADRDFMESFELQERLFRVRLPRGSLLAGRTLAESRLRSALGLHVLSIQRGGKVELAPGPEAVLRGGDRLIVKGRPDLLEELRRGLDLTLEGDPGIGRHLASDAVGAAEAEVPPGSPLVGRSLREADFRREAGAVVLAIRRDGDLRRTGLEDASLGEGDVLLLLAPRDRLDALAEGAELGVVRELAVEEALEADRLGGRLLTLRIAPASILAGRTLRESRLGDAADLTVLGIRRRGETRLVPEPETVLEPGDLLMVLSRPETPVVLRGLRELEVEPDGEVALSELESDEVGLVEAVLSPRTKLSGSTPRQIDFRDKYGLTLLALWRGGRPHRSNLRDMPLELGDSFLLSGPRERLKVLAREPDFLVLTEALQEPPRTELAPVAVLVLAAALLPVLLGWLSIGIAVLAGAALMVLTRCLSPEEAYRSIEWPAVILIAGMIPLGIAMDRTGAALMAAEAVVDLTGDLGPRAVLAGLCILTALGAQVIPSVALVLIMAPVVLSTAADLGLSPHALMMGMALSAASLSSPVAHPANVLVMGPGGYRYTDYLKVGAPLTVLVLVVVVALLPVFLPLEV